METKLTLALLALCLCNLFLVASGACETEEDLDFDSCDLKDLKDEVLTEICNRIGLDMDGHVLPYLHEDEGEKSGDDGDATTRTYTHEDFVRGAEECLMIEDEIDQLEEEDPDYLEKLERDALMDDPEIVAEVIADVLKQDESSQLLKDIASKLVTDAPQIVKEIEGMLGEGEKLEDRPDVVGYIIAKLLSEQEHVDILGELDEALAELVEDWHEEEHYEEWRPDGYGDEL
mmetsp:Transcript_23159/g.49559  ORF Transcript_23159/g.49559 Transcript_23159/m.49559 type:complete len:231 (+) Transcript_23159:138-830(+)